MKINSQIPSNSVSADEIITEVCNDIYDDAQIYREKIARWLFRTWNKLNLSIIRTKREMILPIAAGTKTMMLPPDYQDFIFLGFNDACGNRLPIAVNRNLAPQIGVENNNICVTCGQTNLCSLDMQLTEELVTIDGVDYTKTTSRIVRDDGSYTEEVTEPVQVYGDISSSYPTGIDMQTSRRVVCKLSDSCPDCVPATPGNLNMLAACGCTDALCGCSTDLLPYDVKPSDTHYNLFEQEGFIQFSASTCLTQVVLKYVSSGCRLNGEYIFPLAAFETLISGTYYRSIEKKKNVPAVEKDRARRAYTAEVKDLLKIFTKLSYQEWLEIIDMMPRIPTITSQAPTLFGEAVLSVPRPARAPSAIPELLVIPELVSLVVTVPADTMKLQVPGLGIFSSAIVGNTPYDINSVTQSGNVLDFSAVGTLPKGMQITIYHTK